MGIIDGKVPPPEGKDDLHVNENTSSIAFIPPQSPRKGERRNEATEIVLEYCSKGDLRNYLKDMECEISWRRRVAMALDIARGMAYLHSKDIIFRDLKCRNFLIDYQNRIKLTDFGLARHHNENNKPRTLCGTDGFMAPEVILGMDYDGKSDVFSFGMVIFEMITRQRVEKILPRIPVDHFGLNPQKVAEVLPPDCPKEFSDLALWCCEYEPSARPDFKKIIVALQTILNNLAQQKKAARARSKKNIEKPKKLERFNIEEVIAKANEYVEKEKGGIKNKKEKEEGVKKEEVNVNVGVIKSPRDKMRNSRPTILSGSIFENPDKRSV